MVFKNGSWELYGDEGRHMKAMKGPFVALLFKVATSGSYMSTACFASSTVTGQFRMRLLMRRCSFFRRASNLSIEGSGFVRSFDFAMVEQFLFLFTVDTKE